MKKVLLSLINTDINIKIINTRFIIYILVFLCLLITSCDDPKSPTWQSEINFPLLNTSYKFSEMLNSDGIQEDSSLIVLEFGDTILDGLGIPPEYFVTPGFELDPFSFSIDVNPVTIQKNETIPFSIPENTPEGTCLDVALFHENIIDNFSFPVPSEFLDLLFSEYNYMTVNEGNIVLNLNDDNFLYPIKIEYVMSSEVDGLVNEIFTNENTTINSPENIGDIIIFDYTIVPDYQQPFDCTTCYNQIGEEYVCNGMIIESSINYLIDIDIDVNIDEIYSVTGTTRTLKRTITPSFPLVNNIFDILEGDISVNEENESGESINQLEFQVTNNSQLPLMISFNLLNFKDEDNNTLELLDFTVDGNGGIVSKNKSFAKSSIEYYSDQELSPNDPLQAIDQIYMELNIQYPSSSDTFVLDNLYNFDVGQVAINSIEFDRITTVVHDFVIDTPSLSLSSVPSGIEGIEFIDPTLTLNLHNMIEIDNTISFNLEAFYEDELVSSLNINAVISDPEPGSDETDSTKIVLNNDTYIVYHNGIKEGKYKLKNSLSSFLQVQSDELRVSGQASLNGQGSLEPGTDTYGKTISGDFNLHVPFKIILGDSINGSYTNINMIPAQETFLSPIDQNTNESIESSFIEANLVSSIVNHSPFVGLVSILISTDENFFPLNLDQLINYENFNSCDPYCIFQEIDSSVLSNIKSILDTVELNIGPASGIQKVEYEPISTTDSRVKHLRLFTEDNVLYISRLAMLELPYPILDDEGFVQNAGYDNYVSKIDESQISLINYTDLDKPRYMNTLLTLVNSHYPPSDGSTFNDNGIINISVNDSIKIASFSSFIINIGEY